MRPEGRAATGERPARRPGEIAGTEALVADPGGRAPEIDAIRGWASLCVVCFHVFWETFGVVVPGVRTPFTAPFMAGQFDVVLFFILSGDALSFPFFHGGGARYLRRAILKRYPRLTVPIVVVTAATASLMAAGWTPTAAAASLVGREDWLGTFARFQPGWASAADFALASVYRGRPSPDYLPFLWTMPIELLGSFVLLLALFVGQSVRGAAWITAALAVGLLAAGSFTGCFLLGSLLGKLRADGVYARLPRTVRALAPVGFALALALAGRRQMVGDDRLSRLAALGALLLVSLYAWPAAVRFLARDRLSQFLGRISYLLYLWHYTVLITLTSGLIVLATDRGWPIGGPAALGIGGLTVAASVGLSRATLGIEGWARSVNAALLRRLWREEAPPGRAREGTTLQR